MNGANISSLPLREQATEPKNLRRWLRVGFWITSLVLGFAHIWVDRHYLENTDAMSYLDIAEAYLRGDWAGAVNAYWGPLYSWLTALALMIFKPSPYWKFTALHLVNFAIYIFALGCFDCLINQLIRYHRHQRSELIAANLVTLPSWAWLALGYPLCIWSTLYLIAISQESPDLLVAALIYLASSIIVRIRHKPIAWLQFVMLGLTLGLGFLAKAIFLPLSLVFLAVALFSVGSMRKAIPRVLLAGLVFLLVAGPFVYAMSRSKGRLTFGDAGRLNYTWAISEVPANWQGNTPGAGSPKHPIRKVFDFPAIYEFGQPIGGTYPVWYDPTYWYEGSVPRFDLRRQLVAVAKNTRAYYELFNWGLPYGLLVALLTLYVIGRRRSLLRDLASYWPLIVPALAGMGLYSLITVQARYVAPFLVLLWLALFSAVRLVKTQESQRLIVGITTVLMVVMTLTVLASSRRELMATARYPFVGEDSSTHEHWQIAEGLRQVGVVPGDRVAVIGNSGRSFWANLAGVRIVAEIPRVSVVDFWTADESVKLEIFETFARTGAKVIVAERPPPGSNSTGWHKIGNTIFYYYSLSKPDARSTSTTSSAWPGVWSSPNAFKSSNLGSEPTYEKRD